MDDKTLLELAAKAAGITYSWDGWADAPMVLTDDGTDTRTWNPLADDGDALRLAVKLRFNVNTIEFKYDGGTGDYTEVWIPNRVTTITEPHYRSNAEEATRRAIVCAAAALGEKG